MPFNIAGGDTPKIMVVPQRLNLRRAHSYTGITGEKLPASATASGFDLNHLIFSPPPSPGLPQLVTRPRKSSNAPRPSRVFRTLGWIFGLFVFLYSARVLVRRYDGIVPILDWERSGDFEMIGQDELPEFPTPIAITDRRGRSKWTVSIPRTYDFPLSSLEYSDICAKCHEVAAHVRELHGQSHPSPQAQMQYYYRDSYFVDVREAEEHGLLPKIEGNAATSSHGGHLVGKIGKDPVTMPVCERSMTFVLESSEAGIGPALMMLWTAYGLAQKENRAFFIDDSRWAYGVYTDIFQPPPVPDCRPPPKHEILPCPHHARHLVVSAATARGTFGASFSNQYELLKKNDINRERPVYELARAGYEALFALNDADQAYVVNRIEDLKQKATVPKGEHSDGTIVGVHVRHGDQHPFEYQYSATYMPLTRYLETKQQIIDDRHNNSMPDGSEDTMAKRHSLTVLASDDPDVYDTEEFAGSLRAQERIKLASVAHGTPAKQDPHVMHKFVEESFGWEGGFFASMFWNLGRSTNHADSLKSTASVPPSAETTRLRSLIGRSYMMDLAVLAQGSDVVVCTSSSAGCRLMAVMMGWEKAMENGNWMNIDGNYLWTGVTL
jgi:hypothetical protein